MSRQGTGKLELGMGGRSVHSFSIVLRKIKCKVLGDVLNIELY